MTRRLEKLRQRRTHLCLRVAQLKATRETLTTPEEIETLDVAIARYEAMIDETSATLGARETRRLNGAQDRIDKAVAKRARKAAKRLAEAGRAIVQ